MEIRDFAEKANRTLSPFLDKDEQNIHMILGMVTEVGELADVFKKNMAYGKKIDWVNVEEELGDVFWYLANFCTINNIDPTKVMQQCIDKLMARYPDQFTADKAINRDLEKERKVLESKSAFFNTKVTQMTLFEGHPLAGKENFLQDTREFASGEK